MPNNLLTSNLREGGGGGEGGLPLPIRVSQLSLFCTRENGPLVTDSGKFSRRHLAHYTAQFYCTVYFAAHEVLEGQRVALREGEGGRLDW